MKRKLIELLIRLWMPGWKLARIRGPYRMKMKQITPEQIEQGKELVRKLADPAERR
jgi:hypothetical protein